MADQEEASIAVDEGGNAYAVWRDKRSGNWDIYFAYRPGGGSWQGHVRVNDDPGTADQANASLSVDGSGNAHVVWTDMGNGHIYSAFRPSGGSWQGQVKVNDDEKPTYHFLPAIAVDQEGNAGAVWLDGRNGYADIYFSYRQQGKSWGRNVRLNDVQSIVLTGSSPKIAMDGKGNVYVVWLDNRYGSFGMCGPVWFTYNFNTIFLPLILSY
jgi:hypothetical protein